MKIHTHTLRVLHKWIGLIIGLLVARLGIPSFVVTLALFLACLALEVIQDRRDRRRR